MKANVLQFIDGFRRGGSEGQAVQLSRLLNEDGGFNVFVACLDRAGELRDEIDWLSDDELPEFKLTSFYDLNFFRQIQKCSRFITRNDISVVHTHDFYTNVFGMLAAYLAGVPVRIASRRETTGTRGSNQKRLERGAYRLAHAIVANAEAVREQMISEGITAGKIRVVYNGLDLRRVTPPPGLDTNVSQASAIPAELRSRRRTGGQVVSIVANFRLEVKDHPTFLRSARRVLTEMPSANFVLAGEGPLLEPMRELANELGIGNSTFFPGRCDSVADLLSISDVCVLSSTAEGFSNSILEYMAAGRPVVVTDVGGARETVLDSDTGYMVEAGDDATMAARILSLLREPEAARTMGRRGQLSIAGKFSCERQLQRTVDLYDSLLQRAGETSIEQVPTPTI